jgi:hypothetical protein
VKRLGTDIFLQSVQLRLHLLGGDFARSLLLEILGAGIWSSVIAAGEAAVTVAAGAGGGGAGEAAADSAEASRFSTRLRSFNKRSQPSPKRATLTQSRAGKSARFTACLPCAAHSSRCRGGALLW